MYPGYASRIELELKKIYIEKILKNVQNKNIKIPINIVDSPRRKYSVFAGAAILSTAMESTGVEDYWISKKEWEECIKINGKLFKDIFNMNIIEEILLNVLFIHYLREQKKVRFNLIIKKCVKALLKKYKELNENKIKEFENKIIS